MSNKELISSEDIAKPVSENLSVDQQDVTNVLTLGIEPSYISEVARKLRKGGVTLHEKDKKWSEISWLDSVNRVSSIVGLALDDGRVKEQKVELKGEIVGSPKNKLVNARDEEQFEGDTDIEDESQIWNKYTLFKTKVSEDFDRDKSDDGILDLVNEDISKEDKIDKIKRISGLGNEVSMLSEEIMTDVMERQFREYDKKSSGKYTDPGIDFEVEDEYERDYGLAIEVSVRYVNPIDKPYLESKKEKAFDKDYDLLIMAPRFTSTLEGKHERRGERHKKPTGGEIIHLHRVPYGEPNIYDIFMERTQDNDSSIGNPVIIPDNKEVRDRLRGSNHVSDSYPVVDRDFDEFRDLLEEVFRDFRLITESRYRNQLREAIEPTLGNFLTPYRIEQFLIDFYWNKNLTQKEVGKLVDTTRSRISTWMSDSKWDIITRGSNTPLSKEVKELWRKMYVGEEPFDKLSRGDNEFESDDVDTTGFSGFRIQAEYNRHPFWDLDDWKEWANKSEEERKEITFSWNFYGDDFSYTIMMDPKNRLTPSYTFIMDTLKDMGVEIRPPDEAPRGSYSAYPNRSTLGYMVNRNQETITRTE